MKLDQWIKLRSEKLQEELTQEARTRGFLKKDQMITCKLERKMALCREPVYAAILTEEEKRHIRSGNWNPRFAETLEHLLIENPKKFKFADGSSWWHQSQQAAINGIFREAILPWRLIGVGTWGEGSVYLASITPSASDPIGTVLYYPNKQPRKVF